jgi:SAM-dependent MidA family methyltransferase
MLELRKHDCNIDSSTPLNIVEIGGGTGTLAASVLVSSGSSMKTQLQLAYCCFCIQHRHL